MLLSHKPTFILDYLRTLMKLQSQIDSIWEIGLKGSINPTNTLCQGIKNLGGSGCGLTKLDH